MRAVRHIFLAGLGAAAIAAAAGAQEATVVFDASFGEDNAGPAPTDPYIPEGSTIPTGVDYRIDSTRGQVNGNTQLFHSFSRFGIPADDAATFTGPDSIDFIFARVTGEGISEIDGLLRSEVGDADLFVLNPYGVIFGPTASLDVGGSFHVSTADVLRFDNGQEFEVRSGGAIPMTVAAVVEFGFLNDGESPAAITFDRTGVFGVDPGNTLSAVAGRVEIIGRGPLDETPALFSEGGGAIQLAAVPAGTDVPVQVADLTRTDLSSDEAAIHLTDNAIVLLDRGVTEDPGRIVIRGGRFEMVREQGDVKSGEVKAFASAGMPGGPTAIDIEVFGTISVDRGDIKSVAEGPVPDGEGGYIPQASGDIRLVAGGISLRNGAEVFGELGDLFHAEDGPSIRVETTGTLEIESGAILATRDDLLAGSTSGEVGDIWVEAESIVVDGSGSEISTASAGTGNGGVVHLDADTTIALENGGAIRASRQMSYAPVGEPTDPGRIEIFADQLSVTGGSEILASTSTVFDGPDVSIGIQPGGDPIPVQTVTVTAGSIGTTTTGIGGGGDMTVHAGQILLSSDPDIPNSTGKINAVTQGAGPGGNLNIYADSIDMIDGGQVSTSTEAGAGPAGHLTAEVTGRLFASGTTTVTNDQDETEVVSSGLFSRGADKDGGNLTIFADSIELERGADFSTSARGDGKPGDMLLTARAISVTGGAETQTSIAAKSDNKVEDDERGGGNLTIDTDTLAVTAGGEITTSTTGVGKILPDDRVIPGRDAGNLKITAREIGVEGTDDLDFNRSGITSRTLQNTTGRAGSVTLQPHAGERLTLRIGDRGRASVESQGFGAAGDLLITGADLIDVSGGGEISATVGDVVTDDPGGPAAVTGDIRIVDAGTVRMNRGTMTAETTGNGFGGTINVDATSVELSEAEITARSTADSGGDAGNIVIAAAETFRAASSAITTTAADAGGGRISIQAGHLVYLLDSLLETTVATEGFVGNAGDIDIPLPVDEVGEGPARVVPEFVVINGSTIRANAVVTYAGNITITGGEVLISSNSVIEAESSTPELSGEILISSPDADVISQVTPLPSSFVDPSDRLLPPCAARTERTGSFVVQSRETIRPPPDAPLSPALAGSPGAAGASPSMDSENCPVSEESS